MNLQPTSEPAAEPQKIAGPDICVILNSGSGKRKDESVRERISAALDRHPGRFALCVVRKGRDIGAEAERAAKQGFSTLVAAGGDGTIGAVAEVAHRHHRTLGILPMGTFNYFARGLCLPEELEAAADLVAAGQAREVTVAEVNGRLFLNNASLGIYPTILQQREGTYRRWGRSRLAAHWSVLVTLLRFHKPLSMRVTVDGRPIRRKTPLVFVARSAFQLERFGLEGGDDVRAGRFAVFLVRDSNRWELLLLALRLAWRSMERGRDFDFLSGEEIVVETSRNRRTVARDGERERMRSPFRFRVLKDGLRVIAPEKAAS